ncbi:transcription termination factor [Serpentinimonas raichei]|uniref:Transcription antitermination protein NusB n=1 Tax=Serpentinimonas raichei TaxID=1458425 RepID=A0A060NHM7_9BURK|nr:transcription termination factor [Serpentinimonas raichei]
MNEPTQANPALVPKPRKAADKSARTRSREFAVQALYQHLVGRNAAAEIDLFTRELSGFHKADSAHYDALLHGCIASAQELDAALAPLLDRPLVELSPIEHAVLWIGAYELQHCLDVPWRVVLNECIELAKSFGGTDGHKYVNGVLNQLAPQWRNAEVQRDAANRPARPAHAPSASAPEAPHP